MTFIKDRFYSVTFHAYINQLQQNYVRIPFFGLEIEYTVVRIVFIDLSVCIYEMPRKVRIVITINFFHIRKRAFILNPNFVPCLQLYHAR